MHRAIAETRRPEQTAKGEGINARRASNIPVAVAITLNTLHQWHHPYSCDHLLRYQPRAPRLKAHVSTVKATVDATVMVKILPLS